MRRCVSTSQAATTKLPNPQLPRHGTAVRGDGWAVRGTAWRGRDGGLTVFTRVRLPRVHARRGIAWRAQVRQGQARRGTEGSSDGRTTGSTPVGSTLGWAWLGLARRRRARLGVAWQGRTPDGRRRGSTPHPETQGGAWVGVARLGQAGKAGDWKSPGFETQAPTAGNG
jgi:hypothetical protein